MMFRSYIFQKALEELGGFAVAWKEYQQAALRMQQGKRAEEHILFLELY